ncbi:MAG: hypothetical protein Q8L48_38000 [Archangium sp.]|nr:hypothetical protein [Archangium sp.]
MLSSIRTERLAVTLWLGLAWAGPGRAEDLAGARVAAAEGRKAFERNDFTSAIDHFEEAYRLKPAPGLLFNLGQSHRLAGHLDKASFYLGRFLETKPSPALVEETGVLLRRLELEQLRVVGVQRLELEKTRLAIARYDALAASRRLELERALQADWAAHPITTRWWFWGALGVVTAGTAVAIVGLATAPPPARPR